MPLPDMTAVESSYVSHIGHDGQALYVRWRGGKVSRYHGVPAEDHAALLKAPSVGAAVMAIKKRGHPHEYVEDGS